MRLRVTRLEPRRVLNASPLLPVQDPSAAAADSTGSVPSDDLAVVIDAGSHANDGIPDTFHIYRSGEGIAVSVDGHEVFSGELDPSQSLSILGSADADRLVVHLGAQGLPAGHIDFDGGGATSGHDVLELRGTTEHVSHVVMPHGDGLTTAGGTSISYDGVEALHDVVNASVRELRLEHLDSAIVTGSVGSGLRLQTEGFRLEMTRPQHEFDVTVSGGVGTELHVHEFGRDLSFDLAVDADTQDAVTFTGQFDFDHQDVEVHGGNIALHGSLHSDGGRLIFDGDSQVSLYSDGSLASDGGFVELNAGEHGALLVAGSIDVSDDAADGTGGVVHLLGERVVLSSTADVDASGTLGGGTILVGGDYQGSNPHILNALHTHVADGAVLRADALETGDGGRIIVWADIATAFAGAVIARGGRLAGDGGFAEISGKIGLRLTGDVDLTAAHGRTGTLLLDPDSITIVAGAGADDAQLDDNVINAGDGGGGSNFVISEAKIESLGGVIILQATNSIVLQAGVTLNLGSVDLVMQTTGAAGTITLNGTIVANMGATLDVELIATSIIVSATGGITGADTVSLTADNLAISRPIIAASEIAIEAVTANRDINFRVDDMGGGLKLTNAELSQLSAPVISFATSTGTITVSSPMTLAGAGVTWIFAAETFDVTAAGSLTAVGNITIRTDNASIGGAIVATSPTSNIAFAVKTAARDIDIRDNDGGPAALKFTDTELDQLSAAVISFATATGTITVVDDATLAGNGVTWVFGSQDFESGAGDDLTAVSNLTIRADNVDIAGDVVAGAAGILRIIPLDATRNVVLGVDDMARLALENSELQNLAGGQVIIGNSSVVSVEGAVSLNGAAADIGLLRLQGSDIFVFASLTTTVGGSITFAAPGSINVGANVSSGGSVIFENATEIEADVLITATAGGINFNSTLDADSEVVPRNLILSAGANITFASPVGSSQRLQNLTITAAQNVTFSPGATLALLGSLTQNAGSGTTVLRGGTIGGNLSLTTNVVTVTAAAFDVAGTALIDAQNAVTISTNLLVTGNVTLRANQDNTGGEDFTQVNNTIIGRLIGNRDITIDVNGSGDAFLANLQAGTGTVHVSAGGAIRDNSVAETPLITAAAAALEAGTGISVSADALELDVDVLAAHTVAGSILIEVGNTLTISTVAGVVGLEIDGGSGGIDITLTAGALLIDAAVASAASGTAVFTAPGGISVAANVSSGGSVTFSNATTIDENVTIASTAGGINFDSTLDADSEVVPRNLILSAGANITFAAPVGSSQRLQNLTITTAQNVTFNPGATLALLGSLTQNAGSGTTVLRGGTIGGNLSLTTNAVTVTAGPFDVAGTALIHAQNAVTISTNLLVTGNVTLRANQDNTGGEDFTQVNNTLIGRLIGNRDITIDVNGSGDAFLANLQAGAGTVHVSAGGAIRDNSVAETALITAAAAALEAGTGIGDGGGLLDIDLTVNDVAARTTNGDIVLEDQNALRITSVAGVVGMRVTTGGVDQNIFVTVVTGVLDVAAAVISSGGGSVTLIAAGLTAADDLLVGANITSVGMISLSAGGDILQTAGTVSTSGAGGHIDYDAGRTVALSAGTAVSTALGNISIENHANFPLATYVGVDLDNADVTALNGAISIVGRGGDAGSDNVGIRLRNGAVIDAAGTLTLNATGGNGLDRNIGLEVTGAGSTITTRNADSMITGLGGGTGAANSGILVSSGGVIQTTNSGGLSLVGTGALGTNQNTGVEVTGAGSRITTLLAGELLIRGTGRGTGFGNDGVAVTAGGLVSSSAPGIAAGGIEIIGAGSSGAGSVGLRLATNGRVVTNGGDIVIDGTSDGPSPANFGVVLTSGGRVQSTGIATISLTGTRTIAAVNTDAVLIDGATSFVGTAAGSINVSAFGGDLAMRNNSLVQSNSGQIRLSASDDVLLGYVDANFDDLGPAGDVIVIADSSESMAGAIIDNLAAEGLLALNINGNNIFLSAATGIGSGGGVLGDVADIDLTAVGTILAENLVSGQIQFAAFGNAALNRVVNLTRTVVVDATGAILDGSAFDEGGAENIIAANAILLARNGIGGSGAADLDVRIDFLTAANTQSGIIGIAEFDAVVVQHLSQDRVAAPFEGDIELLAGGTIAVTNAGVRTDGPGSITIRSTGSSGTSALVVNAPIVTGNVTAPDGAILLQADIVDINAAVDAGADATPAIVQIVPHSSNRPIVLGGATPAALSLTNAELNLINARVLAIGGLAVDALNLGTASSAGRITVAGIAAPAGVGHLVLQTATDVFGTNAALVSVAGTLVIDAGSGVGGETLGRLQTDVTTLVGRVRQSGNFGVLNAGALVIGATPAPPLNVAGTPVPALQGVSTANGSIFVGTSAGALTVSNGVNALGASADVGLLAGVGGNLNLATSVSAGRNAVFVASGSIQQTAPAVFVDAVRASFTAQAGDIGMPGDPFDVRVGVVAALAPAGNVFLRQASSPANLVIGTVGSTLGLPSVAGISAAGTVVVTTTNGSLFVESPVLANTVALVANGGGLIQTAGIVAAAGPVTLTASAGAEVRGPITAGTNLTISAGLNLLVTSGLTAGGSAALNAQNIDFSGTSALAADSMTIAAMNALTVAGDLFASGHAELSGQGISFLAGSSLFAGSMDVTATNALTVIGPLTALNHAELSGQTIFVVPGGGSLSAGSANVTAAGALTIGGVVTVIGSSKLSGSVVELQTGSSVTAGSLDLLANAGNISLGGFVSVAGIARVIAGGGSGSSIDQVGGALFRAGAAVFVAGGSVGVTAAPLNLNVGQIAVSSGGVVALRQSPGVGGLIVGNVEGVSGITATGGVTITTAVGAFSNMIVPLQVGGSVSGSMALVVAAPITTPGAISLTGAEGAIVLAEEVDAISSRIDVRTDRGNIILGHRVHGGHIEISAGQPVNAPLASVVFRGGYLETASGLVAGALQMDVFPSPVMLDASHSASILVFAGNRNVLTVDGLKSDIGLTVGVDFRQPFGEHPPAISDLLGDRVATGTPFGPYNFTYDEFWLFEQTLLASERDELFDIIVTGQQNSSIRVTERVGDMIRSVITEGSTVRVTSEPLTQAVSTAAVVLRVPVTAPFLLPEPPERGDIFLAPSMTPIPEPPGTPLNDNNDLIDLTAASSGAAATDRPRLFLVWRLPGLEDQTGRKEFPIVVLAPRYLRALVAELPQGTYWFELEEPGADPRPIGEKFYVRGGRIDVEVLPEDLGFIPDAVPQDLDGDSDSVPVAVPVPDASDDGGDLSQSDHESSVEMSDVQTADAETVAAAGASALGAIGLLKGRWRRRFEAPTNVPPPRLRKVGRLTRRIRRAAR